MKIRITLYVISFFIFANCSASEPEAVSDGDIARKALNSPVVGSKAGSDQLFVPQVNPKSVQANENRNNKKLNPATVGARSGSEQIFGTPKVTKVAPVESFSGKKLNPATVGSQSGSEQIFGSPKATKTAPAESVVK